MLRRRKQIVKILLGGHKGRQCVERLEGSNRKRRFGERWILAPLVKVVVNLCADDADGVIGPQMQSCPQFALNSWAHVECLIFGEVWKQCVSLASTSTRRMYPSRSVPEMPSAAPAPQAWSTAALMGVL